MYWSSVIEYLVEQRLAEARAGASQRALLRSLRAARPPLYARFAPPLLAAGRYALRAVRATAPAPAMVSGVTSPADQRARRREAVTARGERAA